LFVPQVLKEALVKEAHGQLLTGHDGISKTKERLKESYFWPKMDAESSLQFSNFRLLSSQVPTIVSNETDSFFNNPVL